MPHVHKMDPVRRIATGDATTAKGRDRMREAVLTYWVTHERLLRHVGADEDPFAFSGIMPDRAKNHQVSIKVYHDMNNQPMVASSIASVASCIGRQG